MGFLSISCYNFRNLQNATINVDAKEIFLSGENGQGKTNFLEAVYFLCFGSSFRTSKDSELYLTGKKEMSLSGIYKDKDEDINVVSIQLQNGAKEIRKNEKKIKDRKDLVQNVPCIVFSHEDINFIRGTPEKHRQFFNQTLSLYDPEFIDILRRYKKILLMRNLTVKKKRDPVLYDIQLAETGLEIQRMRYALIEDFNSIFIPLFSEITGIRQALQIKYIPSWKQSEDVDQVCGILHAKKDMDMQFGTTTSGPHRDRFVFYLDNRDFGRLASTGQLRLMSLILRIAQARFFSKKSGILPIQLLDDEQKKKKKKKRTVVLQFLPAYRQAFFTFLPGEQIFTYMKDSTLVYTVHKGVFTEWKKPAMS